MRKDGALVPAIMLLLGVLAVQWLVVLPPAWVYGVLAAIACIALRLRTYGRALAWCLFGVAWACWRGSSAMDARLPRDREGQDITIVGRVADLPLVGNDTTGFLLDVEHAAFGDTPLPLHGRVRVNWYRDAADIQPCSRWQLSLRLKRPRGLLNPGGTDSERSALERNIVAVGYVRDSADNVPLGPARFCINAVRAAISRAIAERVSDPHDAALLQAFSVGDTRGLSQHDWEVARANGIPHLIAISGFHVGVAALFGVWFAKLVYLLFPRCGWRLPRVQAQAMGAMGVAGAYSALAGFGLPTVRTLLMIGIVALARCSRRHPTGAQTLALALVAVLLVDPLSVLSAGFWLSFIGVAFLMICMSMRGKGLRGFLHELSAGQLVMTLSLMPLTIWFFGESSLVGALSNLIAVPFVSFVIVPVTLIGMILLGICPPLAQPVFVCAAWLSHAQWWLLERMATWPGAHWYLPEVSGWALVLATLGALWLFAPRGMPMRWLGGLLFLPLLFPPRTLPAQGGFQLWMLDVGQGLSVVVRTEHHALVYDAGARYPSDFDLGEAAVLPSLHALGIEHLDLLVASHADNDHAGHPRGRCPVSRRGTHLGRARAIARRDGGVRGRQDMAMGRRQSACIAFGQDRRPGQRPFVCPVGRRGGWPRAAGRRHHGGRRTGSSGGRGRRLAAGAVSPPSRQQDLLQRRLHPVDLARAGPGVGGLAQPLSSPQCGRDEALRRSRGAMAEHGDVGRHPGQRAAGPASVCR